MNNINAQTKSAVILSMVELEASTWRKKNQKKKWGFLLLENKTRKCFLFNVGEAGSKVGQVRNSLVLRLKRGLPLENCLWKTARGSPHDLNAMESRALSKSFCPASNFWTRWAFR